MERRLQVTYDQKRCIGAGQCAAIDPAHFSLREGKTVLTSAKSVEGLQVHEGKFDAVSALRIERAAASCPSNAIRVMDLGIGEETVTATVKYAENFREVHAAYDDLKEFALDPKGYFLIRTNPEKKEIEVAFCTMRNQICYKVTGKKPIEIYMTVLKHAVIDRADHAAYLGRELQKAYDALQAGISYVQDDELKFS